MISTTLPPGWTAALKRFHAYVASRGSKNTADTYERGVRMFFEWLAPRKFSLALPKRTLEDFAYASIRAGKAASSARAYDAGIRKFCLWLEREGQQAPQFSLVDWPHEGTIQPEVLPPAMLKLYGSWCKANAHDPYLTAMLILPHCGLRITELVTLEVAGVKRVGSGVVLTVKGKGNKTRRVPLLSRGITLLTTYMNGWRSEGARAKSTWLFPVQTGPRVTELSRRTLTSKFTAASRAMGYPLTAHTMRRQYATALHKAGVPLATIARILGHSDPKTTSTHYLAMTGEDLVDATKGI